MFKNLFGLKKQPDEIKIAEEESQMTQDFEQASLEDFKILENEEAIEVLTMPEYGQHSEDYPEIENELEESSEKTIYPIHKEISPEYSDEYLFTDPRINGWPSVTEQELCFSGLLWLYKSTQSVLDVGCGRADLY